MSDKKFNLRLEQYKLDDLKNKKIDLNESDKEYLDYIESSNKNFFEKFNISELAEETKTRLDNSPSIVKFPKKVVTGLLTAAACLILVFNILPTADSKDSDDILLKGSEQINIYLKDMDKIEKLRDLDRVYENDQLQITYKTSDNFGIIFSVDGLNNITFHYPEEVFSSTKLDIGKEVTLPSSYTLDAAPYFEKFYLVTSNSSFDFSFVRNATLDIKIDQGKIVTDLELPSKYNIKTITLLKE
ncbi:hypothetical protein EW093_16180 [Thiospirochaeta perfilievii]|uniref:Uncharacterized protein n=1 Tax=Thiospirochaeta perfilievii TaxID=252967 RepID=A0A5C1QGF9_9SPIO|nr:hypothetical protein [Thiospirochaeta perfilievii]QEN06159.1 hypothetical protein EW093_16180 [Thiospirochaeta perfilievii]